MTMGVTWVSRLVWGRHPFDDRNTLWHKRSNPTLPPTIRARPLTPDTAPNTPLVNAKNTTRTQYDEPRNPPATSKNIPRPTDHLIRNLRFLSTLLALFKLARIRCNYVPEGFPQPRLVF